MTLVAYIALFGWIPAVFVMFALLPGRQAVAIAVIGAWLLLPPYVIPISSFPDYSKNTAATIGMMLGTFFFGSDRVLAFRPRWFDLPMLAWCLCGVVTSLQNGLGIYDGLSNALYQFIYWGLPYLLGRLYLSDAGGLSSFAVAMVIGGFACVLPCLWEVRMSPQLLGDIYGITGWGGTRYGGFRPHLFFKTGLELGMWMTAASLTAWWLWRCGVLKRLGSIPFGSVLLPILLVTTVLCRSTGALILLAGGMVILWASTRFKTRKLLVALVLVGPIYVGLRIPDLWSGKQMVDLAQNLINAERAESLEYRFKCERLLIAKALEQPVFGWGEWNRNIVYFDDNYRDYEHSVPTDGLWIIALGTKGYVGLILLYLAMELPVILFLWRFPTRLWRDSQIAILLLVAVLIGLYMIDCILNAFINIIYVTLVGGLIGITPAQLEVRPRKRSGAMSEVALAEQCRSLGRAAKEQGKLEEARAAWLRTLDILTKLMACQPDTPDLVRRWCDCANDLAWLELTHSGPVSGNLVSTLALARQVVKKCPNSGVYWNTFGVACFRADDFKGAVTALNHSTALNNGGIPFDHVFLAMAHAQLGNQQQAQQWLAQAMIRMERDYPGHPELTRFYNEARSMLALRSQAPAPTLGTDPPSLSREKPAKTL